MRADINLTPEADISEVMGAAGHPQKSTQIYQYQGTEAAFQEHLNYLHEQVCSGAISLQQAQADIASNWLTIYQRVSK